MYLIVFHFVPHFCCRGDIVKEIHRFFRNDKVHSMLIESCWFFACWFVLLFDDLVSEEDSLMIIELNENGKWSDDEKVGMFEKHQWKNSIISIHSLNLSFLQERDLTYQNLFLSGRFQIIIFLIKALIGQTVCSSWQSSKDKHLWRQRWQGVWGNQPSNYSRNSGRTRNDSRGKITGKKNKLIFEFFLQLLKNWQPKITSRKLQNKKLDMNVSTQRPAALLGAQKNIVLKKARSIRRIFYIRVTKLSKRRLLCSQNVFL